MTRPEAPAGPAAGRQVRPASFSDQQKIADLMFFESHVHRHLDWRTPLDWLGSAPYWVLEDGQQINAALALPPDPDSIAWIRLFAYAARISRFSAWPVLWQAAQAQLADMGGGTVAAISTQRWFDQILIDEHFRLSGHIVLLEWYEGPAPEADTRGDVHIRPMNARDLLQVVELDDAAFEPLWRNSLAALSKAFDQSSYATVAEAGGAVVGYQMSSGGAFGAHLARLAVAPEAQRRGIGAALVGDLIRHVQLGGGSKVTVNTQSNNAASLALYVRLGFRRTGEKFPVYTLPVAGAG